MLNERVSRERMESNIGSLIRGEYSIEGKGYEEIFSDHNYINQLTGDLEGYVIGVGIGMGLAVVLLLVSYVLGTNIKVLEKEKLSLFECGFIPLNDSRQLYFVNFYRISILFILFDIEISYLFPWTTCLLEEILPMKSGVGSNISEGKGIIYYYVVYSFLVLLSIGIIYEYKAEALELNEKK